MTQNDVVANAGAASRKWSNAQRAAVIAETKCVLNHPVFKGSNRCVDLLRYLVDNALEGGDGGIKERTLGVEVFGKSPNYDVSTDPIVRRIASEIRKRLALYYHERGNNYVVRIELVRGSYLPEFEFISEEDHHELHHVEESPILLREPEPETADLRQPTDSSSTVLRRRWLIGSAIALLICLAGIIPFLHLKSVNPSIYRVWRPLLDAGDEITVCLPVRDLSQSDMDKVGPTTIFRDVIAGNNISTVVATFKKKVDLRPASALKFRGLQQGPTVLIGGLNNLWVPILLSDLRYSVRHDPVTNEAWIQDSQNLSKRDWKIDGGSQSTNPPVDYAIITRVLDQKTNQWIMALSGLQSRGTEAASRLVGDPKYGNLIPANISDRGNFQIVLETSVVGGEPGPIKVLAYQTW